MPCDVDYCTGDCLGCCREESVCTEADRLVSTDRGKHYGHPLDDFTKVTEAAKALGIDPHKGPEHHALYMVLVKLSRLVETPGHHDSIVDGCGYFKTYDMVLKERQRRTPPKRSLVDELLDERRAEAARENADPADGFA